MGKIILIASQYAWCLALHETLAADSFHYDNSNDSTLKAVHCAGMSDNVKAMNVCLYCTIVGNFKLHVF